MNASVADVNVSPKPTLPSAVKPVVHTIPTSSDCVITLNEWNDVDKSNNAAMKDCLERRGWCYVELPPRLMRLADIAKKAAGLFVASHKKTKIKDEKNYKKQREKRTRKKREKQEKREKTEITNEKKKNEKKQGKNGEKKAKSRKTQGFLRF